MRRGVSYDLARGPVDAAALAIVAAAEADLRAIAVELGIVPESAERIWDAAHRLAIAAEMPEPTSRSRALHAVASADGAIFRLRERALGRPGNETLEHRARRVRETLAEARARVAVVAEGRAAALRFRWVHDDFAGGQILGPALEEAILRGSSPRSR